MFRIFFFISTLCLSIYGIGAFGASGEPPRPVPTATPGMITLSAKTETTTQSGQADIKLPKIFGKKYFRSTASEDDASILRFVSRSTPLTDKGYIPKPLAAISGAHINEAGRVGYIRADARAALGELAAAFEKEFKSPLVVISGYRSAAYQQRLWDRGSCTDTLCAPPGYSEHQLGLAVDLFDATNEDDFLGNARYRKYVAWVQANGHLYGWTQSYQKGEAIDEYEVEPWHWRYIGVDMATRLKNLGWTYTEYIRFNDTMLRW